MINSKQLKIVAIILLTILFGSTIKIMHNRSLPGWFESVPKITAGAGVLHGSDRQGLPIVFEWKRTNLQSADFSEITKVISDVGVEAFCSVELQFLKEHPEAVFQDENFKSFEPLFVGGAQSVDWKLVESQERETLRNVFEMDVANLDDVIKATLPKDYYFFVKARDAATSELLGFVQFGIAQNYDFGDVKVIAIAVAPAAQSRGLGKLLMSSVFAIIPNAVKRLFLSTRPTNVVAIGAYQAWGFTCDTHPILDTHWKPIEDHWIYFEYCVDRANVLQKVAELLKK